LQFANTGTTVLQKAANIAKSQNITCYALSPEQNCSETDAVFGLANLISRRAL